VPIDAFGMRIGIAPGPLSASRGDQALVDSDHRRVCDVMNQGLPASQGDRFFEQDIRR
jgi:hypothetical protein